MALGAYDTLNPKRLNRLAEASAGCGSLALRVWPSGIEVKGKGCRVVGSGFGA